MLRKGFGEITTPAACTDEVAREAFETHRDVEHFLYARILFRQRGESWLGLPSRL